MKISNFLFLSLCVLLLIASVNGWNLPLRVAAIANAVMVLADVVRRAWKLFKTEQQ